MTNPKVCTATIKRDGDVVVVLNYPGPCSVLSWFIKNTSQSMDWALKHEGYSVEEMTVQEDSQPTEEWLEARKWFRLSNHLR